MLALCALEIRRAVDSVCPHGWPVWPLRQSRPAPERLRRERRRAFCHGQLETPCAFKARELLDCSQGEYLVGLEKFSSHESSSVFLSLMISPIPWHAPTQAGSHSSALAKLEHLLQEVGVAGSLLLSLVPRNGRISSAGLE
jgi:hypothetical protein